jgi:hypothetical protein
VFAAVALVACGSSDSSSKSDDFAKAYKPLNAKLLGVGQDLGTAITGINAKTTDVQAAAQFEKVSTDLKNVGDEIAKLDPPSDLKDDVGSLTSEITAVDGSLDKIVAALKAHDDKVAGASTVTMLKQSKTLNTAQNKVAAATGAAKGSN